MKISSAFPPVPQTPDHVVLAEELGHEMGWVWPGRRDRNVTRPSPTRPGPTGLIHLEGPARL